ncbi:MAG: aspartate-semialdehyde dehydrogenase [Tenericutes bacterium]|nr:aspartate-semialdehyde dehydrogenase [Mycoplasmatota bacterium]
MEQYNIAIVGATGLVGQTFLKVIEEYKIPIGQLKLFASPQSKGKTIIFKNKAYQVDTIKEGSFKDVDYALFSAGSDVSLKYAKQAINEGAIVIDNSSAWRMKKDIPLVVPEVNMSDAYNQSLIANPNCSTIQCMPPLKALDQVYGIQSIEYNTYQAVSGAGIKGIQALETKNNHFPYDIKQTCIPQIDVFMDDDYTKEEHKMIDETKKILHRDDLKISATCVRVPVLYGHAISIRVTLNKTYQIDDIRQLMQDTLGIKLLDQPQKQIYPTSIHATGNDLIYVGRIRRDKINDQAVLLYVVADNVRKGAASNAVQIMKGLMDDEHTR